MSLNSMSKTKSGFLILFIYLVTMVIGLFVYAVGVYFWIPPWFLVLVVDIIMTGIIFVVGLLLKNASLYDPYWSVIPPYFLVIYVLVYRGSFSQLPMILLLIAMLFWSIRLTYNWWKNWEGFEKQDWRYDLLKEQNPKQYWIVNLVGIHLVPTIVVYLQMLVAFRIVSFATLNVGYIIGFIFAFSAPIIQFIADKQMYQFRKENTEKGKVINSGLWRFSRHPNYFGELLFWVGIYVMYLSSILAIDLYIFCPIAMIVLFVFISVPLMEDKLKNRPGYLEYQQKVSMIFPFFQKKTKEPRNK